MLVPGKNFRANNGLRVTIGPVEPSDDTPSVTPVGRDSSLREGAGKCSHSTGYSLNREGTGDFHRPYETQRI